MNRERANLPLLHKVPAPLLLPPREPHVDHSARRAAHSRSDKVVAPGEDDLLYEREDVRVACRGTERRVHVRGVHEVREEDGARGTVVGQGSRVGLVRCQVEAVRILVLDVGSLGRIRGEMAYLSDTFGRDDAGK